jgi:predicted metal-dependent hydrolase
MVMETKMRVRQPAFDFSKTEARWAPNVEYAHRQSGLSITIPPLERFLNRVMAKARSQIKGDDPASVKLRAEISTFIKQESCHYSTHEQFNQMIARAYDGIPEIEAAVEAHYARLLEKHSLAFLLAYCEGFESLGPIGSQLTIRGKMAEFMEGADPNVAMLFRWHSMEEFEHRTVVFDTFKRIHGGYLMRVAGFIYQLICFNKLCRLAAEHLLEADRAKMTPEERAASELRDKENRKKQSKVFMRYLPQILMPWYTPHRFKVPDDFAILEREIDEEWGGAAPGAPAPA